MSLNYTKINIGDTIKVKKSTIKKIKKDGIFGGHYLGNHKISWYVDSIGIDGSVRNIGKEMKTTLPKKSKLLDKISYSRAEYEKNNNMVTITKKMFISAILEDCIIEPLSSISLSFLLTFFLIILLPFLIR